MAEPDWLGAMCLPPWTIRQVAYEWFRLYDEWPTVRWLREHLAERYGDAEEFVTYDIGVALRLGYIYGLSSIVAMRLGEALGDWRDPNPLPFEDNGFRMAVEEKYWTSLCGTKGWDACEPVFQSTQEFRRLKSA